VSRWLDTLLERTSNFAQQRLIKRLDINKERSMKFKRAQNILNPMAEAELYERYIRAYNAWYFSDSDYEFPAGHMVRDCFVMD
jgi:hypothetical protein